MTKKFFIYIFIMECNDMKELENLINDTETIAKKVKNQLDSASSTLQIIQQREEYLDEIAKI
jgi:hypothetical protein